MEYRQFNQHPKGKKIGDCVVRAISTAENKKWIDVYKSLCEIGGELLEMPNSKKVYETYLERNGWKKFPMPKLWGKRIRLMDFLIDDTVIVSVAKHLTVCEDNTVIDTWDCRNKCLGNYYLKPKHLCRCPKGYHDMFEKCREY